MKISKILDELTYRSYAHNRQLAPHITPERWAKVFGESAERLEKRFQDERSKNGKQ